MRVALIQSDSGRAEGALRVARELRRRGHEVTLIVPQTEGLPSTPSLASRWRAEGFAWLPVSSARLDVQLDHFPRDYALAAARRLAGIVAAFDTAWFFESHWAMPALRDRRFRDRSLPLIVLDEETAPDPALPGSLEEINRGNSRGYAFQWADAVCSSHRSEAESVGRIENLWSARAAAPVRQIPPPATSPAVTVCVPYFEAPALLPETLLSLERQTSADFTVVVVDDGSCTEEGRRSFEACAERYSGHGWTFVRQSNQFPGAARNRAAREAETEFLIFLDADDIAMPSMVERFLRAALLTGDHCLVAPNYGFRDDPEGPCALLYDPPGNSLIGSMIDDMHGGSCMLVRREAFWTIGGFSEMPGVGFEDYEFHVRCNLHGLRWDVLPEFIYRYRMPRRENVSRSTPDYVNLARVRRCYEQHLSESGLQQLPLALAAAYRRTEQTAERETALRGRLSRQFPKLSPQAQGLRLLLLTSYFPFGMSSGWHKRVQELIRYFGSRYEVTLVALMSPYDLGPSRKEVFRYLHSLRGVEHGHPLLQPEDVPFRVRERTVDSLQAALRALPTSQYHAAIIDQIFMAEFRHDIETVSVLTEHNIESRLLRQAAERSWKRPLPDSYRDPLVEAERMERYENRTWSDFALRAVVSEVDREQMDRRTKTGKSVVAANGADLSTWFSRARSDTGAVLFSAHLGYLPNVDAAEFLLGEIWPEVRKRKPRARLILAGRDPADSVKAAVAASPGVELCANPQSMDRVAHNTSLTLAPLRLGSGTRHKILESMAWGLPVVSTTLGCEGIDAVDGEHLLIRDDSKDFAQAIVELMSDMVLWQKLRNAGRELVRERYSWDHVFEPLEEALIELIA